MSSAARRLDTAIETTTRAARRLRYSLEGDRRSLEQAVERRDQDLNLDALRALDAFVQRYQQTVEHMVNRLYPAIYRAAELGDRPPPTRALLIWLEGQGVIPSERDWEIRIEVRNRLVHEYPLDAIDRAAALETALSHGESMLAELDLTLAYVAERKLLES